MLLVSNDTMFVHMYVDCLFLLQSTERDKIRLYDIFWSAKLLTNICSFMLLKHLISHFYLSDRHKAATIFLHSTMTY